MIQKGRRNEDADSETRELLFLSFFPRRCRRITLNLKNHLNVTQLFFFLLASVHRYAFTFAKPVDHGAPPPAPDDRCWLCLPASVHGSEVAPTQEKCGV